MIIIITATASIALWFIYFWFFTVVIAVEGIPVSRIGGGVYRAISEIVPLAYTFLDPGQSISYFCLNNILSYNFSGSGRQYKTSCTE